MVDDSKRCIKRFTSEGEFQCKWGERWDQEGNILSPYAIAVDKARMFLLQMLIKILPEYKSLSPLRKAIIVQMVVGMNLMRGGGAIIMESHETIT